MDTYNKNWIYRSDNWLLSQRWDLLVQNRASIQFAQVITWNDFGESHYVGQVLPHSAQPNSSSWVNGFDHTGWLDLFAHYIVAFKTGKYPAILRDRIFLWARLYPAQANVPSDTVGKPRNWQWTQDTLWAVVLLTVSAQVNLTCGPSKKSIILPSGLQKLQLPLTSTCSVTASIVRNGTSTLNFAPPGLKFRTDPPSYNFNFFVAASP
ncbi:glycoside hydrolase [Mycena rebaudengoi]|nr:glycoside hydrolase [Mycena rebaudengoi]